MINSQNLKYVFIFFVILLFSHFLPFERLSLSPDDSYLINNSYQGFNNFYIFPDRPLLYLWLEFQYSFLGFKAVNYLIFLFIINFINIIVVYIFYNIFFDKKISFLITVIYILLFTKLEIFHNSIMIHIIIVSTLYLLTLYLLLKFIDNNYYSIYFISIVLYSICIFWYEIGFFLPLVSIFYIFSQHKIKIYNNLLIITPFILIMLFYLFFRMTNLFVDERVSASYSIDYNFINGLIDLFNHHFGRYALRNIIYGMYQFIYINFYYIILFIFFNIFIFFYFINKLSNIKFNNLKINFFLLLFFISVFPLILNGEAGGRNLILSSISFSYFIFLIISFFKINFKYIYSLLILFLLIISQGNAWSQTIASRINNSIINSISIYNKEINNASYFVFNAKNLSNNIKHSLVDNDYNLINTYFGAQVWEYWGISGTLKKNKISSKLVIINKDPVVLNNKILLSKIVFHQNKSIKNKIIEVDYKDVFILDFEKIFKNNFKNEIMK
jgi:hypothetical protein|tara:strand:- start:14662 stop:16158 length:1497 start_codon:yes stop_codon:yes gene_type:complete